MSEPPFATPADLFPPRVPASKFGDAEGAFALADRRRRLIVPGARDLYLVARAHHSAGRLGAAQSELRAALELDPTDVVLDAAALAWGDDALKREAAGRVVVRPDASPQLRLQAVETLMGVGAGVAHGLRRDSETIAGWVAWSGAGRLRLALSDAEAFEVEPDPDHPLATVTISAAEVAIEAALGALSLTLWAPGGDSEVIAFAPPRRRDSAPAARAEGVALTVVVPVYEDFAATRACLDSLARPAFPHRIVVIDDASPNAELKADLDARAAAGDFELLRNSTNLGFAASVNLALATRAGGDALLLNADAVLPPGACERLFALCRSQPDIGTLTPFSNNGELTSYPLRHEANPTPPAHEVAALDALARAANGDALVDMPNGVGFCLYISSACLDAVGPLPEVYAQGYYEDVEFCLRARERGFRNVAAPGVFVGHAGSASFSTRKRALVVRNLKLLETRFPGYRLETAAFVERDPLRPWRAALDALLPPRRPVVLRVCGSAGAAAFARRRTAPQATLTLVCDVSGGATLTAAEGAPQSLRFDFAADGARAFARYFAPCEVSGIEWLDAASTPETVASAIFALKAPMALLCGDLSWFADVPTPPSGPCAVRDHSPCQTCRQPGSPPGGEARQRLRRERLGRALERASEVTPLDRLAETFARRVFKTRTAAFAAPPSFPRTRGGPMTRLGALYPFRSAAIERLLLRLGRRLGGEAGGLVVFGAALDDAALMATGSVFVTGPVAPGDRVETASHYGVEGWLAPNRGGGFGECEAAAAALGVPMAYFDWSFGAFAPDKGDLSLDPRLCDDAAAATVVDWMNEAAS